MKIELPPNSPSPSSSSSSSSSSSTSSCISTTTTAAVDVVVAAAHRRCAGLDLLVKAVYHVAGSVIGVPYIQRRVIRRRKPALRFNPPPVHPQIHDDHLDQIINCNYDVDGGVDRLIVAEKSKKQQRKRSNLKNQNQESLKVKNRFNNNRRRMKKIK